VDVVEDGGKRQRRYTTIGQSALPGDDVRLIEGQLRSGNCVAAPRRADGASATTWIVTIPTAYPHVARKDAICSPRMY
jgi:hypothetical protein